MSVPDGNEVTRLPGTRPEDDTTPSAAGDSTAGGDSTAVARGSSLPTIAPVTRGAAGRRVAGPLASGEAFGPRYHVIKLLGQGGMGAQYQAPATEHGVAVARE